MNQVRDFFELPESVLWCTLEDGDVWWCFAEAEVVDLYAGSDAIDRNSGDDAADWEQPAMMRRVIDRWHNTDVNGNRLRLDSMTTKITKVASFQETICVPGGAADLLNRIRAIQSDAHSRASWAHEQLVFAIGDVRSGSVKQVISTVGGDGVAIELVQHYLSESTDDLV